MNFQWLMCCWLTLVCCADITYTGLCWFNSDAPNKGITAFFDAAEITAGVIILAHITWLWYSS